MADERIIIVNAPAGSGKTTQIENRIRNQLKKNNTKKILCLTYTNRAVEELKKRLNNEKVEIFTIHSFLKRETKLIFKNKEIIEFYIDIYKEKIKEDLSIEEKVNKYKERKEISNEDINIEIIKNNILNIKYNEMNHSRFLYGELSHDDLLYFINQVNIKYSYFKVKINALYDTIYLDEYQDTNIFILNFLNDIVNYDNSNLIWYLYGDDMQKIYNSEDKLSTLKGKKETINKNYRSSNEIIKLLNNIYNQEQYKVDLLEDNKHENFKCKIELYDEGIGIEELKEEGYMNLSSNHDDIFKIILGSNSIKEVYESLKRNNYKVYSYTSNLRAVDLLMNIEQWEKDILLRYLKIIFTLKKSYNDKKYGKLLDFYRNNKELNQDNIKIRTHQERKNVEDFFKNKFENVDFSNNYINFIELNNDIFREDILLNLEETEIDYEEFKERINLEELWKLFLFITSKERDFDISTQHGVKGESHNNVNLICVDNKNSHIDYSNFFEIFSNNDVDVLKLESEFQKVKEIEKIFLKDIKLSKRKLTKLVFDEHKEEVEKFKENINSLNLDYGKIFLESIDTSAVTKFNKIFTQINECERYILTFKIFYVGCSRAREKLIIKVPHKIVKDYEEEFLKKMKSIGFEE